MSAAVVEPPSAGHVAGVVVACRITQHLAPFEQSASKVFIKAAPR